MFRYLCMIWNIFKLCIKVYGSLFFFGQYYSSRWMDDSQRNLFKYLYVNCPRIVWIYTTLLLIQKESLFLFLKITSWFYLFSPHPSFFFKIPEKIMNVEALCKCIVCEFHLRFLCLFITVDFCRCGWRLLHLMMKIYECKCYFYIVYNMFAMGNVNVESQKYCPYFLNTNCYFI